MAIHVPVPHTNTRLPPVDARLAEPEMGYEIIEGRRYYVPPCDEPHGSTQSKLAVLLDTHRAEGFSTAVEMLTRTSETSDIAPDASIYPTARHPVTGGRQLEHLAFEVCDAQTLSHSARKARMLAERGVRRVFAIDVKRLRVLEWNRIGGAWVRLDPDGHIEDASFAVPLPVAALVDVTVADEAIARALRLKRHPEFLRERAEGLEEGRATGRAEGLEEGLATGRAEGLEVGRATGRAEGLEVGLVTGRAQAVLLLLEARGLAPSPAERERILVERDRGRLERWLLGAASCATVAELLGGEARVSGPS